MGEIIKVDFGKKAEKPDQEKDGDEKKVSLLELYQGITLMKSNPEIISSFCKSLEAYTFEELTKFMEDDIVGKDISETKIPFIKAIQKEIRLKKPKEE